VERERGAAAAMLGLAGFVVLAVSEQDGELAIETTAAPSPARRNRNVLAGNAALRHAELPHV
jgi:hypothetical protein